MNPRSIILIAVAGIGVLAVVLLTRAYLSGMERQVQQVQATSAPVVESKVLVAARDLGVGTILKAEDFVWQPWPLEGINKAYFEEKKDKLGDLAGMVVRLPVTAGEPLTRTAIVAQGERGFMAAILTPGMRAVSVQVSPVSGIGGFIFPGDRVDVILSHEIEASRAEKYAVSETVLQNVRVLAVDQRSLSEDPQVKIAKIATLEVTPKMAEKVAMLANIGTLSLSLRSLASKDGIPSDPDSPPIDANLSQTMGSDVSHFLPSLDADTASSLVRVTRGSTITMVEIDRSKKGTKK